MQIKNNRTILCGVRLDGELVAGERIHPSAAAAFLRAGWTADPLTPLFRRETATHTWTAVRQAGRWLVRLFSIGYEGRVVAGFHQSVPEVLAATRKREAAAGADGRPSI